MNATLTAICLFLSLGSPQYRNDSGSTALLSVAQSQSAPVFRTAKQELKPNWLTRRTLKRDR